jgi:hypothetical protein
MQTPGNLSSEVVDIMSVTTKGSFAKGILVVLNILIKSVSRVNYDYLNLLMLFLQVREMLENYIHQRTNNAMLFAILLQ